MLEIAAEIRKGNRFVVFLRTAKDSSIQCKIIRADAGKGVTPPIGARWVAIKNKRDQLEVINGFATLARRKCDSWKKQKKPRRRNLDVTRAELAARVKVLRNDTTMTVFAKDWDRPFVYVGGRTELEAPNNDEAPFPDNIDRS